MSYDGHAQSISGEIISAKTFSPVKSASVSIDNYPVCFTNNEGRFQINEVAVGNYILRISSDGYTPMKLPIVIAPNEDLWLGKIFLRLDKGVLQDDRGIEISINQANDGSQDNSIGLFQEPKDLFQKRVAFDFNQSFFRIRGYPNSQNMVMINGISMKNPYDDSPSWAYWGGLNDVTREQDFSFGMSPSQYHFGALLGTTNIFIKPELFRGGTKITSSLSNKSYNSRLMLTHNSGKLASGWSYSLSLSRRTAQEGYVHGTSYNSYSVFLGVSYGLSPHNTIGIIGLFTPIKRGLSAAITDEMKLYTSRRYNPFWGFQNGKIRNSRQRYNQPFTGMIYHQFKNRLLEVNSALAFQRNRESRSRLNYQNAPNPDPTYYRKLPSYNIISNQNETSESLIDTFKDNSQIDWDFLYEVNQNILNGNSAYILYDDNTNQEAYKFSSSATLRPKKSFHLDIGISASYSISHNYASIRDFLGSKIHNDIDIFSQTENNTLLSTQKSQVGDKIKYHYTMDILQINPFIQAHWKVGKIRSFMSANYSYNQSMRDGLFKNQRYEDSFGKSRAVILHNYGMKGGIRYDISAKNTLNINVLYQRKGAFPKTIFFNPREHNQTLPFINYSKTTASELSYILKTPSVHLKCNLFGTYFQDLTEVHYFYADSGIGSGFFQEVTTGINKLHIGSEFIFEYDISELFKVNTTVSIGQYTYANNPNVRVNFNPSASRFTDPINTQGYVDLGESYLKNYVSSQGPNKSLSIGMSYNSPRYWWISPVAVILSDNYVSISKFLRTESFFTNPNDPDGYPFGNISSDIAKKLLQQEQLPALFLLDISGGKSWRIKGKYLSLMVVLNNVLDVEFKSGGYEQSRSGNYQSLLEDRQRELPIFGNRYWQGRGRTFFINLSLSF